MWHLYDVCLCHLTVNRLNLGNQKLGYYILTRINEKLKARG